MQQYCPDRYLIRTYSHQLRFDDLSGPNRFDRTLVTLNKVHVDSSDPWDHDRPTSSHMSPGYSDYCRLGCTPTVRRVHAKSSLGTEPDCDSFAHGLHRSSIQYVFQ